MISIDRRVGSICGSVVGKSAVGNRAMVEMMKMSMA